LSADPVTILALSEEMSKDIAGSYNVEMEGGGMRVIQKRCW